VPKPPIVAQVRWKRALVFDATSAGTSITIDGDSREGPSPMQVLVISLAGCMSADVAHILAKGRTTLRALDAEAIAERAQENPHRVTSVKIRFTVKGDVPRAAVERAIGLSHEKYCSVWHSMRQDIAFETSFEVVR
jgi:putative redox protein